MTQKKSEHLEMEKAIVDSMTLLLGHNSLHQVLKALSKGCMARCREMLNADTPKDENGNTLRALLDFSERIDRLSNSARSHNPDSPKQSKLYGKHKVAAYKDYKYERPINFRESNDDIE